MAISKNLSLFGYNLATNQWQEISAQITDLLFTTVAPGGYGRLTGKLRVSALPALGTVLNARIVPPQLAMFANVALMDGRFACFLGRWDEVGLALSDADGLYYDLSAMGASNYLLDDPQDSSYSVRTAKQIVVDQLTGPTGSATPRSNYLPLDQDQTGIFPDNPAATYSPAYAGKDVNAVLTELVPVVGDYQWVIWGHLTNKDALGFPTWQLLCHTRDTSTVSYTGYLVDEHTYDIRPSIDVAYNVITLIYKDSTSLLQSSVTVRDSRLNSNLSQGTAPFPMRRLRLDKSSLLLSATEAATIANALLAEYLNGGYKITVELNDVRDANGKKIPLNQVRGDANMFLPELFPLAKTLANVPTANQTVFYIIQTEYSEPQGSIPKLTVTFNTYADVASLQLRRLEYIANNAQQSANTTGVIQTAGLPEIGTVAASAPSNAPAASVWTTPINFKAVMVNGPSSLTLTASSQTNVTSVTAAHITNVGASFNMTINAGGVASYSGTYQTVGN